MDRFALACAELRQSVLELVEASQDLRTAGAVYEADTYLRLARERQLFVNELEARDG